MLQLLINLLTPIFEGMGVSPTDVATYVHNLSGYIYAILGTLVLAKNNGVLPLSGTDKINVFGWAATNPIYGGTGSGSSSNEGNIDILTSLKTPALRSTRNALICIRSIALPVPWPVWA